MGGSQEERTPQNRPEGAAIYYSQGMIEVVEHDRCAYRFPLTNISEDGTIFLYSRHSCHYT